MRRMVRNDKENYSAVLLIVIFDYEVTVLNIIIDQVKKEKYLL
jgi:hypothetical protein